MPSLAPNDEVRVAEIAALLSDLAGTVAIVLGGSHARGRAHSDSDIDIGIYYREDRPFSVTELRQLARKIDDSGDPVVADFYEWGPWVNGGAWLTIDERRFDLLFRSIDHCEAVISDAKRGRYETHFGQQPPFGFFSPTYLGELHVARILRDDQGEVARLKAEVERYPEKLRASVVQSCLWGVEFGLAAFAPKFAKRNDAYNAAGCIARFVYYLVLALFALNRRYFINDKTALEEISEFERAPTGFRHRVTGVLAAVGDSPGALSESLSAIDTLFEECVALAGDLYRRGRAP